MFQAAVFFGGMLLLALSIPLRILTDCRNGACSTRAGVCVDVVGSYCESTSVRSVGDAAPIHAGAGATADMKGTEATRSTGARRTHRAPLALYSKAVTVAGAYGIPIDLFAALIEDESSWRPDAIGERDEEGLLQLRPSTGQWCGGINRLHADSNLDCGGRWFRACFDTFGSWDLAILAFKAGPERIDIPPAALTYMRRTLLKAEAYR
jgi:hypothetical protein